MEGKGKCADTFGLLLTTNLIQRRYYNTHLFTPCIILLMKTANGFLNDKKVVVEYGEQAMSMKMK